MLRLDKERGNAIDARLLEDLGHAVPELAQDESVQGVRRFLDLVAAEKRVTTTALQMVGTKGYDGLAIALVTSDR